MWGESGAGRWGAGGVSVAEAAGAGEEPWRSRVGMTDARSRSGGAGVLQGARQAPRTGINVQLADSNIGGASLTRAELREELDRFRDEILRDHATTADFANLKSWIVAILLVAVLNLVGTVRAIVAAVLTG